MFAGGRDSYVKYAALLDPIINEYHETDSTKRFKGMIMQDILDSGITDVMTEPNAKWTYFE